jgi:hypothetical protein
MSLPQVSNLMLFTLYDKQSNDLELVFTVPFDTGKPIPFLVQVSKPGKSIP